MVRRSSSTNSAALTGTQKSRTANGNPFRLTVKRVRATSDSRITGIKSSFATFESGYCHECQTPPDGDDVSPVFRLGSVVRDDGHLPQSDIEIRWDTGRTRVRHDGDSGNGIAVFCGHDCRQVLSDGTYHCAAAHRRSDSSLHGFKAADVQLVLSAAD